MDGRLHINSYLHQNKLDNYAQCFPPTLSVGSAQCSNVYRSVNQHDMNDVEQKQRALDRLGTNREQQTYDHYRIQGSNIEKCHIDHKALKQSCNYFESQPSSSTTTFNKNSYLPLTIKPLIRMLLNNMLLILR